MFGLVSAKPVSQRALLVDAPRSLGALSVEHPDGWGLALSDGEAWTLHKSVRAAAACELYERVAREARASLAIAHVRQKTVGETALENTHPFVRGRFVLAHNGTVKATATLSEHSSAREARRARRPDRQRAALRLSHELRRRRTRRRRRAASRSTRAVRGGAILAR
jgi:predicted glutamine amidotransferase